MTTPHPLDQVRGVLRRKHYLSRTEEAYLRWITCYILFHNKQHPKELDSSTIEAPLTHLAVEGKVAASSHTVLASGRTRPAPPGCLWTAICSGWTSTSP